MFAHLDFKKPNDLGSVRSALKRLYGKKIVMRCHYAESLHSQGDWLSESEHYSNQTGTPQEEEDGSFTLMGKFCSSKNIDRDIAEMQPHDSEGRHFFKKYASVQIITTE